MPAHLLRQLGFLDDLDAVAGLLALAVAQLEQLLPVVDFSEFRFAFRCHFHLSTAGTIAPVRYSSIECGRKGQERAMAKDAIVSDELAQKFATEKDTPYLRFVRGEGLDIISAHYVQSLRTVELKPWARRGGNAVFINHEASRTSNDCYVLEIPPGKSLAPTRHLFEEMIFILDGRGSTTVWNDAGQRVTFEWKAGALFGIPMNCWHQHFNGSGREPARYVAVTNGPAVINLYEDIEFVFNTKHDFKNRFSGEPDYFSNKGEQKGLLLQTNFVSDAVNLPLISAKERGAGGGHIRFNMARG